MNGKKRRRRNRRVRLKRHDRTTVTRYGKDKLARRGGVNG